MRGRTLTRMPMHARRVDFDDDDDDDTDDDEDDEGGMQRAAESATPAGD